jgi:PTH1 family peptidyl-tRNA hydrolase
MWLIVGLGNPGPKYADTRHNIGFMVVDALAARTQASSFSQKFKAEVATGRIAGESVALVKPLTFMNLSGDAVQPAMAFYKATPETVVVVHDDLDLPLGTLRLKKGGGHGGHNGLRHITEKIGADFVRVRAGIGRPERQSQVTSHVLAGFSVDERIVIDELITRAADAAMTLCTQGLTAAQQKFHTVEKKPDAKKASEKPALEKGLPEKKKTPVDKAE